MKTLFPRQQDAVDFHLRSLAVTGASLDTSKTGTGKTVVSANVALRWGGPVAVVCPKIVIPHWKRELEEVGVEPVFVLNYEKLRTGRQPFINKRGKKTFDWNLPENTLLIWDECHKCQSPTSQNSMMLVAAKNQSIPSLLLSATACQDPTEMRSIGYALELHSMLRPQNGLKSWPTWMKQYGCWRDQWRKWRPPHSPKRLAPLHQELYHSGKAIQLKPTDLPKAFADNHVITEPLEFAALKDINRFYEDAGITSEIIEWYLEDPTFGGTEDLLVELLRARQLAEAAKVPDIIELAQEVVKEGCSAAIFVNFRESAQALFEAFDDAALVVGGQSDADREANVQSFQNDERRIVVANIAAGGVGVSLHDVRGEYPRVSLISPTYDHKQYEQALGRIHRNGAKSPATQRVLVASGTIEEKVLDSLEKKRQYMGELHH